MNSAIENLKKRYEIKVRSLEGKDKLTRNQQVKLAAYKEFLFEFLVLEQCV